MTNRVGTGTVLAGKYRLEALIGQGGMGSVWRAEHLGLSAPVAVKLLDILGAAPTDEALQRFHREARAAANIRSPHVVQILDHGVDEATHAPYIVMELMEGESLAARLEKLGRLAPAEVAHVFTHVARALLRAHEAGIVHRDLKPDNVFLVHNADEVVAKVLDFGIAKANTHSLGTDSVTRTGAVMGTAYYMSPDQISGAKNIDFHTDLWAFGVMACECLTGKRPFDADSIGGLTLQICVGPIPLPSSLGRVPVGFDAWFSRIVTRDRSRYFGSAREAADALRSVLVTDSSLRGEAAAGLMATIAEAHAPPRSSTMTTGAPLAVAANSAAEAPPKSKSWTPWAIAGVLVAGIATAGGVWLNQPDADGAARAATSAAQPMPSMAVSTEPAPGASAPAEPFAQPPVAIGLTRDLETPPATSATVAARPVPAATIRANRPPTRRPPAAKPSAAKPPPSLPNSAPVVRDVIDERH